MPVMAWANESLEITRHATVGYCVQVGNKCVNEVGNEEFEASRRRRSRSTPPTSKPMRGSWRTG
jgi:hypothetical protein